VFENLKKPKIGLVPIPPGDRMVAMNEIRIHPTDERVVDQLKKLGSSTLSVELSEVEEESIMVGDGFGKDLSWIVGLG
jgi:hypothetical protein